MFLALTRWQMVVHYLHHYHNSYLHSVSHIPRAIQLFIYLTQTRGYIIFPDVPHRSKPRFLTAAEHDIANIRLKGLTAPSELKVSRAIFKRVFGRWHWYVFVVHWTLMDQNFTPYSTPFSLYLKAKPEIYSVSRVNTLPTIATALSVVAALVAGVTADRLRNFWIPSVATSIPVLIGVILLVVYNVGETGRLVGFILTGFEGGMWILNKNTQALWSYVLSFILKK